MIAMGTGSTSDDDDSLAIHAWYEVGLFDKHGKAVSTRYTLLDARSAEHRYQMLGLEFGRARVFMRRVEIMHGYSKSEVLR